MILYGIDQSDLYRKFIKGTRVALLTNITGRSSQLQSDINILYENCELTALFGPEHGVRGNGDAGAAVESYEDRQTGLPVFSLYGSGGRHFTEKMLELFDVLIYDIQDIGVRFFTYLSTLHNALTDCAAAGKPLIVMDRPNPLGDEIVEGNLVQDSYKSFVGCCSFPYRYGLTAGEAAEMMNREESIGCELTVIPCAGWKRSMLYPDWDKVWIPPSPALMNFESVMCYPGTCLLEGTNVSEGRGTAAPFRVIGADYIDGEKLSEQLNREQLPGVVTTPAWFVPSASKYQGKNCSGVMFHVTDHKTFRPVTMGITLLDILRNCYGEKFQILPPPEKNRKPMLSLLSGDGSLLGDWNKENVIASYETDSREFCRKKQKYHIY